TEERLLARTQIDVAELSTLVGEIVAEDQRAAEIINGLHSMLKRRDAQSKTVNIETLINSVLTLARAELMAQRVRVNSVIAPSLPEVRADAVQIQQVLLNLMLNACEAMSAVAEASRVLHITAGISDAQNVRLSIRDT